MNWKENIPGTEINRITFIAMLIRLSNDPLAQTNAFRSGAIREIAAHGVLNGEQIASVIGCSGETVRRTVTTLVNSGASVSLAKTAGKLDPAALEGMYAICQKYAIGRRPRRELLTELTPYVDKNVLNRLTGVPLTNYDRARAAA